MPKGALAFYQNVTTFPRIIIIPVNNYRHEFMTGAGSALTLQVLGSIEGLLLLKEESVADKR